MPSGLIFFGLLLSVTLRLGMSNWFLDSFYPYTLRGGSWLYKIHPGSIVALSIFLIVLLGRNPVLFLREQRQANNGPFQFAVTLLVVILVSIPRFGFGGTAYLIDTFALTAVYSSLATYITHRQKYLLVLAIFFIVTINSLIAISEYILGRHFLTPSYAFSFFRASALFGHPLANALLTTSTAIVTLRMRWSWMAKSSILSVMTLSLFAFGGRGSLASLTLGVIAYLLIVGFTSARSYRNRIGILLLSLSALLCFFGALLYVIFKTDIGAPIASRLTMDSSIQSRISSLAVLSRLDFSEVFWGMSQDRFNVFTYQSTDLVVRIENFWVILLLRLGLPAFLLFSSSFLYMFYRIAREGTWVDGLIVIVFLTTASTNNSLAGKSPALAAFLLLLVCARGSLDRPVGVQELPA